MRKTRTGNNSPGYRGSIGDSGLSQEHSHQGISWHLYAIYRHPWDPGAMVDDVSRRLARRERDTTGISIRSATGSCRENVSNVGWCRLASYPRMSRSILQRRC